MLDRLRELRFPNVTLVNLSLGRSNRCEFPVWIAGAQQDNDLFDVLRHDADRLYQVRIVRDNRRHLETPHASVIDEMAGEIDVRPFFLGVVELLDARVPRNSCDQWSTFFAIPELAKIRLDLWASTKRLQVHLLASWLVGIVSSCDAGGEVFDPCDRIVREKACCKRPQVEPFEVFALTLDGSMVQVEAIHIHVRFHVCDTTPKTAKAATDVTAFKLAARCQRVFQEYSRQALKSQVVLILHRMDARPRFYGPLTRHARISRM